MSIYSTNRFKSLSAEYALSRQAICNEAPDVTTEDDVVVKEASYNEAPDVTTEDDGVIKEAAMIDTILEFLD
jgi:hypothetical protein